MKKVFGFIWFILTAIPIPFCVMSSLGLLICTAALIKGVPVSTVDGIETYASISIFLALFFEATYPITYIVSLLLTLKKEKICVYSFLLLINILLFALFYFLDIYNPLY